MRTRFILLSFISGAAVMAAEMCASRMVAPHFGSSTPVWAALISFVLAGMATGAFVFGRLADSRPSLRLLCNGLAIAAALLAALPFAARLLLGPAADNLLHGRLLTAAALLLPFAALSALPVLLLGGAHPYLLRIAADSTAPADLGQLAGRLSAGSTVGSIFGTLLSAMVVIPALGTTRAIAFFALVLAAAASAGLPFRARPLALIAPVAALVFAPLALAARPDAIDARESPYALVQTLQRPDGRRELILDQTYAVQSTYRPGQPLLPQEVFGHYVLAPLMRTRASAPPRVLFLGLGAGTGARGILEAYPGASVTGVELDPEVIRQARAHFDLPAGLTVHNEDARTFLSRNQEPFDVIVADAFRFPYVPFHLVTEEFDALAKRSLAEGGVFCVNVGRYGDDKAVVNAVAGTLARTFPEVVAADARNHSNTLLFAGAPGLAQRLADNRASLPFIFRGFAARVAQDMTAATAGDPLTDDHAPVEQLTDGILFRALVATRGEL